MNSSLNLIQWYWFIHFSQYWYPTLDYCSPTVLNPDSKYDFWKLSLITFPFSLQMITKLAFLPVISPGWILIVELNLLTTIGTVDSTILSILAHKYCMSYYFVWFLFLRALKISVSTCSPFKSTHIFIAIVPNIFFTKLFFSHLLLMYRKIFKIKYLQ